MIQKDIKRYAVMLLFVGGFFVWIISLKTQHSTWISIKEFLCILVGDLQRRFIGLTDLP